MAAQAVEMAVSNAARSSRSAAAGADDLRLAAWMENAGMAADERALLAPIIASEFRGLEGLLDLKLEVLEATLKEAGVGVMTRGKFTSAVKTLRKEHRRGRRQSASKSKAAAATHKDRRGSARALLSADDGFTAVAAPAEPIDLPAAQKASSTAAGATGAHSKFDVFLSYRVSSEHRETRDVYQGLRAEGVHPYRDKECLEGLPPASLLRLLRLLLNTIQTGRP